MQSCYNNGLAVPMSGYVTVNNPMHHDTTLLFQPELFSKSVKTAAAVGCGDK